MSNKEAMMQRFETLLSKYQFTEEEKGYLNKAKNQVRTYVFASAVGGSLLGIMTAVRRKPFSPLRAGLLSTGFAFVGTQVGFVFGYSAAMRTIKSMPDQDKIKNLTRDVIQELQKNKQPNRGFDILGPPDFKHKNQQQQQQQQLPQQQSRSEQQNDKSVDVLDELLDENSNQNNSKSVWDQIRTQNQPQSSKWDKVRQQNQSEYEKTYNNEVQNPEEQEKYFNDQMTLSNNDKNGVKTNKYGDIIEFTEE